MKTKLSYFISLLIIVAITFCLSNTGKSEEDMSHCLVKYKSEWNQPCSQCKDYSKSYRVYFRNECEDKIDVKCASQEIDLRWRTFTRLQMLPKDTITAYACQVKGKFMTWVRKAGDKEVVFPTDEEINETYGK